MLYFGGLQQKNLLSKLFRWLCHCGHPPPPRLFLQSKNLKSSTLLTVIFPSNSIPLTYSELCQFSGTIPLSSSIAMNLDCQLKTQTEIQQLQAIRFDSSTNYLQDKCPRQYWTWWKQMSINLECSHKNGINTL